MVLTDPDAAIVDAHERIDALEESVTTKVHGLHRRIDAIESDRVARMAELERTFNAHRESVYDRYNHGSEKFNAALDRIHTLECGEKELYARCQEVAGAALEALRDRDRQDRWHASYNAALGSNAVSGVEARHINAVHESCAAAADRAHGPLEIVVPAGTQFDEAALAKGGKLVSQPGWSQWDARVEALVKAAKRHLCGHTRGHHRNECGCTTCELAGAAEPFESRGGE